MSFLFSSKKPPVLSCILEIQSGLIRGALVSFEKGTKPYVLYLVSRPFVSSNTTDGSHLTQMMLETLAEVARLIQKEGLTRAKALGFSHLSIHTVHYVMSSPWVIPQSKTVKIKYEKDTEITNAIIKSIVDKERNSFLTKFKEGNFSKEYEFDLTFIEEKIFDVRLNGYVVEDYKGKKVKELEISFAVTTSSKHILDKIHHAVSKNLHIHHVAHHSALILHYLALRSILDGRDEYISLHVHSELTDIVIIKRGVSSYLASFPFGISTIIRRMAKELKGADGAMESLLSMYENSTLEESQKKRVSDVISPILDDWQVECFKSLESLDKKEVLPKLVYLSAHSNYDLIRRELEKNEFEVLQFDETMVSSFVSFEKVSERSMLIGMYILALENVI